MKFHFELMGHKLKWNLSHLKNCRQKTQQNLFAANIFITIYIQLNIRTPDQKYLANQVDWWISWISNFRCCALALNFDHKSGYISSCSHNICPK